MGFGVTVCYLWVDVIWFNLGLIWTLTEATLRWCDFGVAGLAFGLLILVVMDAMCLWVSGVGAF